MRKSTIYLFILGVAVVVMAAIASAGVAVSAQNSNSSTTNMNMAKPKPKPWRHKRTAKPATTGDAAMATPQKRGKCDPTQQEQTDLSGTYTGKMKHGDEPMQDATLTITGNSFSGTMGGQTISGRIVAVTTCGYTAVTIMHEGHPRAMSLRAKKMGDNLMLTSVPGEPEKIMFTTGGGMAMKGKPRKHRAKGKPKTGMMTAPAKTTP